MDIFLTLFVAVTALVGLAVLPKRKPRSEVEQMIVGIEQMILGGVAEARNGRMESGRLVLDVDELRVDVEVLFTSRDTGGEAYGLRWRIELPRPETTTFQIYPEGAATFASKLFGGDDVEVKVHSAFDYTFMVKADDDVAVRRLWRDEQCAALMAISRNAVAEGKQQVIVIEAPTPGFAPDVIERGIDLMISLGRTDLYGVRVLSTLPDAMPLPDSLVRLPGPGGIRVGPHRDGEQVRTRIWSEILVDRDVAVPGELGSVRLDSDGVGTTLTWDGIEEDPRRLLAAVAFMRSLREAPALGVFR